ncbi:sigma factor-like helix-turn-helix DNA-binding protein [Lysinibacillus sp. NPDC056232]|uniref:sigma factor-like helix-turn-helix DNA-binding protein n=1 Tax=Lysinibacillus sp. NPDC056232 TaxID=3345756 RepID=UPI0035DCECB9
MFQNRLLKSFLDDEKVSELYKSYLKNPTTHTRDTIEKLFQIHVRKIQLLSYFSRVLHFESQRYDKKIRRNNRFNQLILDNDINDGENKFIDLISNESLYGDFELIYSTEYTHLETIFEDKQLYNIVSKLSQKKKHILHSIFVENLTEEEVSKKIGVSKQAVNKVKNETFQKIRQDYKKI